MQFSPTLDPRCASHFNRLGLTLVTPGDLSRTTRPPVQTQVPTDRVTFPDWANHPSINCPWKHPKAPSEGDDVVLALLWDITPLAYIHAQSCLVSFDL